MHALPFYRVHYGLMQAARSTGLMRSLAQLLLWSWMLAMSFCPCRPNELAADGSVCTGIHCLVDYLDNTWIRQLNEDPAAQYNAPNTRAREVHSGHYVHVEPTPLPQPMLVATSREMAAELGLNESDLQSDAAVRLLSGDMRAVHGFEESWATPYALSIYGQKIVPNGCGKDGDGYGDGRAISIGEVVAPTSGARWELQLKGGGKTPFARTADGRAVLRSSVREFLASEAMHSMGVPTTRALSLVVSREPHCTNTFVLAPAMYSRHASGCVCCN